MRKLRIGALKGFANGCSGSYSAETRPGSFLMSSPVFFFHTRFHLEDLRVGENGCVYSYLPLFRSSAQFRYFQGESGLRHRVVQKKRSWLTLGLAAKGTILFIHDWHPICQSGP